MLQKRRVEVSAFSHVFVEILVGYVRSQVRQRDHARLGVHRSSVQVAIDVLAEDVYRL